MDTRELYPVIESVHYALNMIALPALSIDPSISEFSESEIDIFIFSQKLDPIAITPNILTSRFPFYSLEYFLTILNKFEKCGLLQKITEDSFTLSESGNRTLRQLEQRRSDALSSYIPLPVNDLMDLTSRLKEVSDSCISVGTPPGKWCIQLCKKHAPAAGSPIMSRIDQIIKELIAFHDDASLSVWKAYCVSGHAWDILTVLWMEEKSTISILQEKLAIRGFSSEQTFLAVEELAKKGLVLVDIDEVKISPFGHEVRKIAEDTIDRYYYAPWKYFSDDFLEKLLFLLNQCHKNISVLDEIFC